MITCREVDDYGRVVQYLRRDVFGNNCFLDALEHNVPPVPRRVYVAEEGSETCGVMSVEDFGDWVVADLRDPGCRAEAIPALARQLDPDSPYRFSVRAERWEHLRPELADDAVVSCEILAMTVARDGWRRIDGPGEMRRLASSDAALTDDFPAPANAQDPTLTFFTEKADASSTRDAVFGLLLDGRVVSYVQFGLVVDDVWEVGMIETREECRGRGLGKRLLSEATSVMLSRGVRPLYQVNSANTASVRTAQAVGYYEAFRVLGVDGRLRAADGA